MNRGGVTDELARLARALCSPGPVRSRILRLSALPALLTGPQCDNGSNRCRRSHLSATPPPPSAPPRARGGRPPPVRPEQPYRQRRGAGRGGRCSARVWGCAQPAHKQSAAASSVGERWAMTRTTGVRRPPLPHVGCWRLCFRAADAIRILERELLQLECASTLNFN